MQARYYDPAVGRFLSVDPVGAAPGGAFNFNRYGYANNNPVVNIDPDGRCTGSHFSSCPGGGYVAGAGYVTFVNPDQGGGRVSRSKLTATQNQQHAPGCDGSAECDQVKNTAYKLMHDQAEAEKEAGIFGLKFIAINAFTDGLGRIVGKFGRLGRLFGWAQEDTKITFRSDTSHIFRNARGHLSEDTAANRALLQGVVRPSNFFRTEGPGGSINVYRETLSDGRQVWVKVRGNEITNGGINNMPY